MGARGSYLFSCKPKKGGFRKGTSKRTQSASVGQYLRGTCGSFSQYILGAEVLTQWPLALTRYFAGI